MLFCLFVFVSIIDPPLNCSRYQNTFHTTGKTDVQSFSMLNVIVTSLRGSHLLQTEWVCYLQEIVFIVGYFSSASCVMTTLVTSLLHCCWLCCLNIYIMATNSNTKLCTSWQSVHIFQWPSNTFNISKKLFAVNSATVIYTLHTCSHNRNEMFLLHNILGFSVRLLHNKLMGWDMRNVIKSNIE